MNDLLRSVMAAGLHPAAWLIKRHMAARIRTYAADQAALRARYGITPDVPVVGYDETTRARIKAMAASTPCAAFAATSGSTNEPKHILFTRDRLARFKRQSRQSGLCAFAHYRVTRVDLFIMGSLKADDSFTSLLLGDGSRQTGYLEGLADPTRYLRHAPLSECIESHGALATRIWLMVACNAGVLNSTNPSTLAVFLADLKAHWADAKSLIRDTMTPSTHVEQLLGLARRVGAKGWRERMHRIAASTLPLSLPECVPALHAYCCWDGGYVGTFLESIQGHLPPDRFTHIPMYSMSTETVQTVPFSDQGALHYLPLAEGVLYEFLPEGAEDTPELLLPPEALEEGSAYTMVVSDPYGLVRYQTEDLFRCVGQARGLPDLRFERRRGLTYSFTGEKLTGEQLSMAFRRLRTEAPSLVGVDITCMPSQPDEPALPGYKLILAYPTEHPLSHAPNEQLQALAARFDTIMCEVNDEFMSKIETNRLAPTTTFALPYEALAAALDRRTVNEGDRTQRSWESQFKLTPLTRRRFEAIDWTS